MRITNDGANNRILSPLSDIGTSRCAKNVVG
jgi:hypothetical protein